MYHLDHKVLGVSAGQHLYVTPIAKSEDFKKSYDSIVFAIAGVLLARKEIFDILKKIRQG